MGLEKMQSNSTGGRCPHCGKRLEQPGLIFTRPEAGQSQQSSFAWSAPQCPDRCQENDQANAGG